MLFERGVKVDHTTIYRWVQRYAPEVEKRLRWYYKRPVDFHSWRVDETYVKVAGQWAYLYRALDKQGHTVDFYLSPRRNAKAAKRFLGKALNGLKSWQIPHAINTDKAFAYSGRPYIRVSSFDQNPERQLEHIKVDKIFTDKASGKDTQRPQLDALITFVREGDTVVVHSMDRLARNLDDLRRLVQEFTQRKVCIEFVKEHLTFTGEDSPMANLMLSVMGAFAEFERALIRERQREGIALARQRAYRGRKKALSPERTVELRQRAAGGEQKTKLAREFGVSRETLYQYLRIEN